MRAFRLAYDGTGYRGFQRQPHRETVEDAVLDALGALGVLDGATPEAEGKGREGDAEAARASRAIPPGYAAAGRTDAGVSAVAQTVAFEAPDWLTPAALDAELPGDVRAWASAEAPPGFHATRDARRREYVYFLHAPDADADRAADVCEALSGRHDFHNLTTDDRGTERNLEAACRREGAFLVCRFAAGGFPRQLVRRAVGLVGAVATGERDPAHVERVLSAEALEGPAGVAPAPAAGLVLSDVAYPPLDFEADDRAAPAARAAFDDLLARRRTGARVADRLREL